MKNHQFHLSDRQGLSLILMLFLQSFIHYSCWIENMSIIKYVNFHLPFLHFYYPQIELQFRYNSIIHFILQSLKYFIFIFIAFTVHFELINLICFFVRVLKEYGNMVLECHRHQSHLLCFKIRLKVDRDLSIFGMRLFLQLIQVID